MLSLTDFGFTIAYYCTVLSSGGPRVHMGRPLTTQGSKGDSSLEQAMKHYSTKALEEAFLLPGHPLLDY